jgi:uncharacterized membrane protein YfcA
MRTINNPRNPSLPSPGRELQNHGKTQIYLANTFCNHRRYSIIFSPQFNAEVKIHYLRLRMLNFVLLFFAGLIGGMMNAAAGGGSFVTFPAMIYAGIPSVAANASSTVALLPGSMVSAWKFRKFIKPFPGVSMVLVFIVTLVGGAAGALLLLYTPSSSFDAMVPWLLLTGSMAFAFGKRAGDWLRTKVRIGPIFVLSLQFMLGIYGGYFGGAVGIMMLAVWTLFGLTDIYMVNANKTMLVGTANAMAVIIFIVAGKIYWADTLVMMAATITGGYLGAILTTRIKPEKLRKGIVIFNFLITAVFFIKTYL